MWRRVFFELPRVPTLFHFSPTWPQNPGNQNSCRVEGDHHCYSGVVMIATAERYDVTRSLPATIASGLGLSAPSPHRAVNPEKSQSKKQSQKSHLLSRLSLLEQEVQKLGGQNQPRAPSTDQIEQEYRSQDPQIGWILPSWLAGNLEPDQSTKLDEHDSEPRGKTKSPQDNSATLSDEFGRLVLDRNSGTSRYVNHRVLTGLADQVYHTLNGARSIVDSFKQAC